MADITVRNVLTIPYQRGISQNFEAVCGYSWIASLDLTCAKLKLSGSNPLQCSLPLWDFLGIGFSLRIVKGTYSPKWNFSVLSFLWLWESYTRFGTLRWRRLLETKYAEGNTKTNCEQRKAAFPVVGMNFRYEFTFSSNFHENAVKRPSLSFLATRCSVNADRTAAWWKLLLGKHISIY